MNHDFLEKIRQNTPQIGTIVSLPSPEMAELLAKAGFDWLFIDGEHSAMDFPVIQRMLMGAQPHCPCIVRIASHEETWIKKILDMGPDGIIIPLVNTKEQAQRLVDLCLYPPQGKRSVGIARAHAYGPEFLQYLVSANANTAIIIQIEHIQAVENVEEILSVPGIDGVFIGPFDLSASMGIPGQVQAPDVVAAIDKTIGAAKKAQIPLGVFCMDTNAAQPYMQQGFGFVAIGTDSLFVAQSAGKVLGMKK